MTYEHNRILKEKEAEIAQLEAKLEQASGQTVQMKQTLGAIELAQTDTTDEVSRLRLKNEQDMQ